MSRETISHYEIIEKLGEGGMGVVFKARDTKLDREVAIKLLPPHLSSDKDARKRFIQEAKSASSVDHSHICTIYEIDETDDGSTFIVMAYYKGETLRERIDRGGITPDEAIGIASQIASGLARAHNRGIIHRDIKPQNIIITDEGEAKIIDFGLAKLAGKTKLTKDGSTLGTAAYMSPEQARGEEIDHRSDIFSLGTILYEMLAGEPPFKGEHEAALLYVIVHEAQNQLPDTLLDEYPDLKYVSARMLEKDPAKRYQSMDELRADLIGLMGDTKQISSATRSSLRRSEWRSKRRFGYIGLAVLAVVVLFAAYFLMQRDKHVTNLRSIAVLPFENIVTETGYEWFGDAQRERITGHLTKINGLKVISNVSSNRFRDSDLTPSEIAGNLGVTTLLKASVQQSGGRLLLMIKLIDARTNDIIWAEDYDRELAAVFDVQAEVALSVANQLRARLAESVEGRISARPTDNLEAYKLLWRARVEWASGDVDRRAESLEFMKQAIEIDPEYSQAYGQLAMVYFSLPFYGYRSPRETTPIARKNALKALEIDEGNQIANTALSLIKMMYDWDWKGAEEYIKKCIDLYPGATGAYENYAWILLFTGRIQEMVDIQDISRELDPLSESKMQNDGERLYYARRYDEAIKASLDAIELNPNYAESRVYLGLSYIKKGLNVKALEVLEEELKLFGYGRPEIDQMIGTAFAMAGAHARAREVLDFLLETSRDRWVPPSRIANIYFALGEDDLGFEWLERAFAEHDPTLPFIKVDPVYDRLNSDPGYIAMLEKLGLAG